MMDCIFCKIIQGQVPCDLVFQDDQLVVIKDIRPKAKIHLLVVPRLHIPSLQDIDETHRGLLAHILMSLPKIAMTAGLNNGFKTMINTGVDGGQEIPHLHFHLLGGGLVKS